MYVPISRRAIVNFVITGPKGEVKCRVFRLLIRDSEGKRKGGWVPPKATQRGSSGPPPKDSRAFTKPMSASYPSPSPSLIK